MWKKLMFKLIKWLVFAAIVTCPFWSVLLVMDATSKRYPAHWQRTLTYCQRVEQSYFWERKFNQVGLEGKYYAYFRHGV
jgi:hypothetical protein